MPLDVASRRILERTDYMDLTTKGRKTGKPRTVELSYVLQGDEILCLAGSGGNVDWYQNLLRHPNISVSVGKMKLKDKAEPISGDRKKLLLRSSTFFAGNTGQLMCAIGTPAPSVRPCGSRL